MTTRVTYKMKQAEVTVHLDNSSAEEDAMRALLQAMGEGVARRGGAVTITTEVTRPL